MHNGTYTLAYTHPHAYSQHIHINMPYQRTDELAQTHTCAETRARAYAFLYMYTHTHFRTHTLTHTHTRTHVAMHICHRARKQERIARIKEKLLIHTHMHTTRHIPNAYTHMQTCTCTCMHICIYRVHMYRKKYRLAFTSARETAELVYSHSWHAAQDEVQQLGVGVLKMIT